MPFAPLHDLLPEVANTETRRIKVLNGDGLPRGTYIFAEMFCNDERCDCRRAFIQVLPDGNARLRSLGPLAIISFGWEAESFYRKWASFPLSNEELREMKGPALATLSPQSEYAAQLLAQFKILVHDGAYVERIARHYKEFRALVDARGPRANLTVVRSQPKPGMNQPCPCGSGTKYKRCCWGKESAVGVKRA
jgi:hypothetical protein